MTEYKLSDSQIKTLKLFSYYIKSYGKQKVHTEFYVSDCELDDGSGNWFGSGAPIDSYPEIDNVINDIIEKNNLSDTIHCDYHGNLTIWIDADESSLEIVATSYIPETRSMGDSMEINEFGDSGKELIEYMKQHNIESCSVDFSGGGDSGEIYEYLNFGGTVPSKRMSNDMSSKLYDWLEDFYGGWEINEGSQGTFTFYNDGNVELDFGENYDSEHSDTVFETTF